MSSVAERISSDVQKFLRDFGETFSYTNADSETSKVWMIFYNTYQAIEPGGLEYSGRGPAVLCASADVPSLSRAAQFVREKTGVTYYFLKHDPDNDDEGGMSTVELSTDTPHG
jgi:hypothetical protein